MGEGFKIKRKGKPKEKVNQKKNKTMKSTLEKLEVKKFDTIVLTITIENEAELRSMWHRMNVVGSSINVANYGHQGKALEQSAANTHQIWCQIDEMMKKLNITVD